ncbi:MAG: hypothetical protein MUO63_01100 [Desulfobulbaceae bacterium]|nr:hypothetical protein [Desulfobulbaceae bacterium]
MITNIRTATAIRNTATRITIITVMTIPSNIVMAIATTAGRTATTIIMMPIRQLLITMIIRDTIRNRTTMTIDRRAGRIPAGSGMGELSPARYKVMQLRYNIEGQAAGLIPGR